MLSVTNLGVAYQATPVLTQINFTVAPDEILAVVGPSGAGKTTLLKALTQMLPSTGTITLNGDPISPKQHTLALVPQSYGLLPWKTVRQNIALAVQIRQHHKLSPEQEQAVDDLMATLGLTAIAKRYPGAISGGQAQRVALARAFCLRPDLLMLDEAFSALDTVAKATAQRLFLQQWQQRPVSTLLITHNLDEALNLANKLLILADGTGTLWANPLADLEAGSRDQAPAYAEVRATLQREVTAAWHD